MKDLIQNFNIGQGLLTEFSNDELGNLLKIAKEIENANPIDINLKKGTIEIDGQNK